MGRLKKLWIALGVALVAVCAIIASIPRGQGGAPPSTPGVAASSPTPSLIAPATPTPNTPAPIATQSPEERYITIAQGSALPNIRKSMGVPDGEWSASVINLGEGPELQIRIPLNPATSNEQFVRLAKQNLAQIINALFVADPALGSISAIGTFPDQAGESPAVSIIVLRGASADWGSVTADQLDGLAERVDIKPEYR